MGSKGSSGGSSTVTQNIPPDVLAAYKDVTSKAQSTAGTPYTPYGGQLVADMNSTQNQALSGINNAQGAYQPYFNQAQGLVNQGTQGYSPAAFSQTALQQYQNPYTQDVINSTLANTNIEDAKQQSALQGNAIAKGAWGGDRADLARNDLARNQALARNQTVAGLENQNYSQALGQFNQQNQTGLQAAGLNNQSALSGAGLAGALGTNAQQNALSGAQAQLAGGTLQQQQAQNLLNTGYQQFQQQQAYPFNTTQWLANIVEGIGGNQSQGSTTSTSSPSNGMSDIIGTGLGLAGLFFKKGGSVSGGIEGYASGGGMNLPDIELSYIPQTSSNAMMPQMQAVAPPQAPQQDALSIASAINPDMMKNGFSGVKNIGKGIGAYGKSLMSGLGGTESLGEGLNAAGKGSSAYDLLSASDAGAGGLGALASMFGFKDGGGIQGYAKGGWNSQPLFDSPLYSTPSQLSLEESNAIPQGGMVGGAPLSATANNDLATMLGGMGQADIAAANPNNNFSSMLNNSVANNAPRPTIATPQQAIAEPPALADLQSQLAKNAPELDKGMALSKAGFAMAANKDNNFFHNVGAGALAGLEDYSKQKTAVAEYALKQAEAQKRAEQLAIEAERYNKMLQLEQEKVDQGKFSLVPGMGKDAKGNDVAGSYKLNAKTGEQEFLPGVVQSQKANVPPATGTNRPPELSKLTGDEFIDGLSKSVNPDYANEIKSLADTGNIPSPKTGRYDNSQMLEDIYRYKGDASSASKTAITRFDSGVNANQIRFNSTAMTHLDTLAQAAQALKNNDTQALNKMQNTFKTQFGSSAPTNFNAARDLAAGEIVKAITQTGGTLEDRKNAEQNISNAESPEQLAGVINTYQTMLGGQLYNQFLEYKSSTGQSDKKFMDKLDTSAKSQMQSIMAAHGSIVKSDTVKVKNAKGQTGTIPASQLQDALKAGYVQVQ